MNLAEILDDHATRQPDRPAVMHAGGVLSHAEFADQRDDLAGSGEACDGRAKCERLLGAVRFESQRFAQL